MNKNQLGHSLATLLTTVLGRETKYNEKDKAFTTTTPANWRESLNGSEASIFESAWAHIDNFTLKTKL